MLATRAQHPAARHDASEGGMTVALCAHCHQPITAFGLTDRQVKAFMAIADTIRVKGISPSISDLQAELQLKSRSGIHRILVALEERGYIQRLPHRHRGTSLTPPGERFAEQHRRMG